MGLSKHNPARRREAWVLAGLLLFSLLMTLKYFPGVEWDSEYAGNIFQAIHPEAFPGDPAIGSERSILEKPFQLSSFYLLVKAMGEIWLDDRFTAFFYLGLVLATLIGVDRIVKLAGLTDVASRLAIQLVFMRDHQFFDNKVTFAHQQSLNATAISVCLIVWLIYLTVSRKSLWAFLSFAAVSTTVSMKAIAYPIAAGLAVLLFHGNKREKSFIIGLYLLAGVFFIIGITYIVPIPEDQRIAIWNLMFSAEDSAGNPFRSHPSIEVMLYRNALFLVLCLVAWRAPYPDNPAIQSLRLMLGVMFLLYLVVGLYLSFAPDAMKIPQIIPFSLGRFIRWPQTIAYLLILISLFHWMENNETPKGVAVAMVSIGVLLIIGPGNHGLWGLLFLLSCGAVLVLKSLKVKRHEAVCHGSARMFAQALAVTIVIAFGSTIWSKSQHWKTWAEIGVIGNSPAAKVLDVSRYFRKNTPPDTVVLPLDYNSLAPGELRSLRGLATRSGRTMPVPIIYGNVFNLSKWEEDNRREELLKDVQKAFYDNRWPQAAILAKQLTPPPDYVVIPNDLVDPDEGFNNLFSEEIVLGDYRVLKILDRPGR
ncbi:MAG TPA: hypothetical protein HPP84_05025 [Rhodospirillaceae bacterium]|nr:hypothetical protein [Rhodospirillaceae bacterium]